MNMPFRFCLSSVFTLSVLTLSVSLHAETPKKLQITDVWYEPAGPSTSIQLNNRLIYSVVLPDGNSADIGDDVFVSRDDDDSLSTLCFENGDYCTDASSVDAVQSSTHKIVRVLESENPKVSTVELDNLRIVAFENHGGFAVQVGDGVNITNTLGETPYQSVCVFGKDDRIFCTDSVSMND